MQQSVGVAPLAIDPEVSNTCPVKEKRKSNGIDNFVTLQMLKINMLSAFGVRLWEYGT